MSHTVSGQLRKATFTKQLDNGGTMFAIELSEFQKDKDGQPVYTNYKAAFFPKSQAAYDHLSKALVEGNFVVVTCDKLKIDVSSCGQYTKLDMQFAKLDNYMEGSTQPNQNQQPQQQGGFAPNQPQAQGGFNQGMQQNNQGMQQQGNNGLAPQQQQQGGGFNQNQQQGGFNNQQTQGGFAPQPQGGMQQQQPGKY